MAVGDVHLMGVQGNWCGAPIAFTLEYLQIQPDVPGEPPGKTLVDGWFIDAGAPWLTIRSVLSNDLAITCVSYSSDRQKGAVFLTGANTGLVAISNSMPTTVAVLMHIRARGPHPGPVPNRPKFFGGRFFLPGLTVSGATRSVLAQPVLATFGLFGTLCVNIAPAGVGATMFRLMPFAPFTAAPGGLPGSEITAVHCFPDALLRRIKTRKPSVCQTVGAQGLPPGTISSPIPPGE